LNGSALAGGAGGEVGVGFTFAPGQQSFGVDLNKSYAKYFEDCGVGVVAMEGMDIAFGSIPDVPSEVMYSFIKKKFLDHRGADAIYILGSGWDTLGIVAALEQDLGVAVVQPIAARIWEIQRRLHVRQPIKGYGILLETLPVWRSVRLSTFSANVDSLADLD
jgi:maleate cis-trans isomerase